MSTTEWTMTAPPETYQNRRAHLAATLSRPLILFAGHARPRQIRTMAYPFRAGSHYLYFGGPPMEGAALLVEPGSDGADGTTLIRPARTFDDAVWVGPGPDDGQIAAAAGVRVSAVADVDQLASQLEKRDAAYLSPPCSPTEAWAVKLGLKEANTQEWSAIVDLRLIKDKHEMTALRRAAELGVQAHRAAMAATAPGGTEAKVAAALIESLTAAGGDFSFSPIVTVRGEILHCEKYPNRLEEGQLLLVDAGAEEPGGYASDITRTYPVNGKFDAMQRQLYDTALRAERAAIAACVPGKRYREIHDLAAEVICRGLVEAGILRGDPADLTTRKAHTLFFSHGVGHLLGLDVHDIEDFGDIAGYATGRTRRDAFGDKFLRFDRDLEPGMVVTIEPGVYIVPEIWANEDLIRPYADVVNRPIVDALLGRRFGGIRIEDDVHVRAEGEGPEVLTETLPATPDELEAIMGRSV